MSTIIETTLDKYIKDMDQVHDFTNTQRDMLIAKTMQYIAELDTVIMDPEVHSAKMMTLKTASDLLNDYEKNRVRKVDIQMKKKNNEDVLAIGKVAVEVLKNINVLQVRENMKNSPGTVILEDDDVIDAKLAERIKDQGIEINPNELKDNYQDLNED